MGPQDPLGGEDPFAAMAFLGDLFRNLASSIPTSAAAAWESARQCAVQVATEGVSEPNVDPAERMAVETLGRVADLHVEQASGLTTAVGGRSVVVRGVNRTTWAGSTLEDYRPLLERLSVSMNTDPGALPADLANDPAMAMVAPMMKAMAPMLLAMTAGTMVGQLAARSLGGYDLPIPRRSTGELLVVVNNVTRFAEDWSLPRDEVQLWVCANEIVHHAVLGVPHVRATLSALLDEYAAGFRPDPTNVLGGLADLDGGDLMAGIAQLQERLSDPDVVLGAVQTAEQRRLLPNIEALVAAIEGYCDHIIDTIAASLIPSHDRIGEALRRHRVETGGADRFVERILGLNLTQAQYDRGSAFVGGVVERAGTDGLARLWSDPTTLPTPAEVDAPGLWLARIDLASD